MLSYNGLCQRRRIHCNRTTSYRSLFFLVLWTSICSYLVQKLIWMLNIVWQEKRDMIVVSRSPCVFSWGIISGLLTSVFVTINLNYILLTLSVKITSLYEPTNTERTNHLHETWCPEKTADISGRQHWLPTKRRLKNERRNSIPMTCHFPDLGSASDWLQQISLAVRPIGSTTQTWIMTRHQCGISALVP